MITASAAIAFYITGSKASLQYQMENSFNNQPTATIMKHETIPILKQGKNK